MKNDIDHTIDAIPKTFTDLIKVYNDISRNEKLVQILHGMNIHEKYIIELYIKVSIMATILELNIEEVPTNLSLDNLLFQRQCIPNSNKGLKSVLDDAAYSIVRNRISMYGICNKDHLIDTLLKVKKKLVNFDTVCNAVMIYLFDVATIELSKITGE